MKLYGGEGGMYTRLHQLFGANKIKKSMRNLVENTSQLLNDRLWWKIRPTYGPIICGTKWDRDKHFFFFLQKEGVNGVKLCNSMRIHRVFSIKNQGEIW